VLAFRLCRVAFQALDGGGARLRGRRWNWPGRAAVLTCSSRTLTALENLAHVDPENVPCDLVFLTIDAAEFVPREAMALTALLARSTADAEPPGYASSAAIPATPAIRWSGTRR
jgi:RES domain-containing protein